MRVVPRTLNGKISFYTSHLPTWALDPEAIGSTPEEIADLQDMLDAVKNAYKQQSQAQQTARAATLALSQAVEKLTNTGGSAILRVRAKARNDGQSVYTAAAVRRPKQAAPIAPPGQPGEFSSQLEQVGFLKLTWACKNPRGSQGTMYEVSRQLGTGGQFQFLGTVGKKQYLDQSLPAGTANVTYRVIAVRTKKRGPAATYTVSLGVSGTMPATILRAA